MSNLVPIAEVVEPTKGTFIGRIVRCNVTEHEEQMVLEVNIYDKNLRPTLKIFELPVLLPILRDSFDGNLISRLESMYGYGNVEYSHLVGFIVRLVFVSSPDEPAKYIRLDEISIVG